MNIEQYFRSLGSEVEALKSRVRDLKDSTHWLTDGQWKESVLRTVLRRNLADSIGVGNGFVVAGHRSSHQLDIIVYDRSAPILFRDGNLVFVTPDAVRGIIEVKSRVTADSFGIAARKLAKVIELVRLHPNSRAFAGLFCYEDGDADSTRYLEAVVESCSNWNRRVDFASIGQSYFLKYWNEDPETGQHMIQSWHSYDLPQMSVGYFVNNVVDAVAPHSVGRNRFVWFPHETKEVRRSGVQPGQWTISTIQSNVGEV
jgi:hypothetical protein